MASRIVHMAIANEIMKKREVNDSNRFLLGSILPDAVVSGNSHRKIITPDGNRKTYDLSSYRGEFADLMLKDDLYLGFYLHIVQDLFFRQFVYKIHRWDPKTEGNVERLHNDYALANTYVIQQYKLRNNIAIPAGLADEPLMTGAEYEVRKFIDELDDDFVSAADGEYFFFTKEMTDEYIHVALEKCMEEISALKCGSSCIDEYELAWNR